MQPPICSLCDRDQRDHPGLDFDLVRFADYEPIEGPGHPEGLLWFCEDHLAAARELSGDPSDVALRRMREDPA